MIGPNDEVIIKNADPYDVTKHMLLGSNVIRKPSVRVKPLVSKTRNSMLTVTTQSKHTIDNTGLDSSYFWQEEPDRQKKRSNNFLHVTIEQ